MSATDVERGQADPSEVLDYLDGGRLTLVQYVEGYRQWYEAGVLAAMKNYRHSRDGVRFDLAPVLPGPIDGLREMAEAEAARSLDAGAVWAHSQKTGERTAHFDDLSPTIVEGAEANREVAAYLDSVLAVVGELLPADDREMIEETRTMILGEE